MRAVNLLLLCPNEPPLYILPLSPLFPSAPYYRMSASSVSQFKLYQTNLHAHKTMRNKIVPFSFQHYTNVTRILCRRFVYHNLPELHFIPIWPIAVSCLPTSCTRRTACDISRCFPFLNFRRWYNSLSSWDSTTMVICMWRGKLLARVWRSLKPALQSGCKTVACCSDLRLCPVWPGKVIITLY